MWSWYALLQCFNTIPLHNTFRALFENDNKKVMNIYGSRTLYYDRIKLHSSMSVTSPLPPPEPPDMHSGQRMSLLFRSLRKNGMPRPPPAQATSQNTLLVHTTEDLSSSGVGLTVSKCTQFLLTANKARKRGNCFRSLSFSSFSFINVKRGNARRVPVDFTQHRRSFHSIWRRKSSL